jgi:peptidoglycan/LPS O-acetylase OafA/YrhL
MSSEPLNWPKRLHALDATRGLAALAVALWHWQHFAFVGDGLPKGFDRSAQPFYGVLKLFYERGDTAVDYFFVLSGFVFYWLYSRPIGTGFVNWRLFSVQRFSRLYPLHFATLLLVAFGQWLYTRTAGHPFIYTFNDWYHFVLNATFTSHWGWERGHSFNGPIWSVSIEILLYILFFLIARSGKAGLGTSLAISIGAFAIYETRYPHDVFRGITMFFLGGAIFHVTTAVSRVSASMMSRVPIYGICALSWGLVVTHWYVTPISQYLPRLGSTGKVSVAAFTDFILLPSTVCTLALLEIDRGRLLNRLSWVGDITYASYLLHFPLQLLLALAVTYGLVSASFWLHPASLVAFFIVLVVASRATFAYFERPLQNWLRVRLERRDTSAPIAAVSRAPSS